MGWAWADMEARMIRQERGVGLKSDGDWLLMLDEGWTRIELAMARGRDGVRVFFTGIVRRWMGDWVSGDSEERIWEMGDLMEEVVLHLPRIERARLGKNRRDEQR